VFKLILKDLVAARWLLIILIPFYVLQLATFTYAAPLFLLATLVFTALLGFGSIGLEDHQNTETLWCSLPVDRREVVLGRYLSVLLGVTFGIVLSWLTNLIVAGLAGASARNSIIFPDPWRHAALLVFMVLLAGVFLPCYFRFGASKGLAVFSALGIGALIVFSLPTQLAFYLAGHSRLLADPELWRETAAKFSAAERARLAHLVIGILALLASAAFLVSAGLSIRFYEKRDL